MSQFVDKLNRVARAAPQSIGFRTAQAARARPQMLLVASLAQPEGTAGLAGHITGADAVLIRLTGGIEAKAIQKMTRSLDMPWGAWLAAAGETGAGTLLEAGGDFAVFPAASAVSLVPRENKLGKVLQVDTSLGDSLLRAISALPVDAVLITGEARSPGPLSWHDLMLFQRAASLLSKPRLVAVPPAISADELKALWNIGVDGVVIETSKELPPDRFEELRRAAAELAASAPRQRGRLEARLPSVRMETPAGTEEEEEEE